MNCYFNMVLIAVTLQLTSIYAIMGLLLVFVVACVLFNCVITVLLFTCISYMSCSFLPGYNTKTATIAGHMVKTHLFGIGDYKTLNSDFFRPFTSCCFIYPMMYGSTVYIMQCMGNSRAHRNQGKLLKRAVVSLFEMGVALKGQNSLSWKTVAQS